MIRQLWIEELPDSLRCEAWKAASGNPACLSEELYEMTKFRAKRFQDVFTAKSMLDKQRKQREGEDHLKLVS